VATKKYKVIGLGGIGTYLIDPLCRYLSYTYPNDEIEVTLIDGDAYEERNRNRQQFSGCENKALGTVNRLRDEFPKIHFRSNKEYITKSNVIASIREDDTVLLCVDNHATRKIVSDRCESLKNAVLISGGNDFTDGDVLKFIRQDGKSIGRTLVAQDRRIANPGDKNPGELTEQERQGCVREAVANPQLLFTNLAAASHMLNVLYAHDQNKDDFDRVCFDILTQCSRSKPEKVLEVE
jgi:molybdopterin/thiamine biosynthesis adenylyltransferase